MPSINTLITDVYQLIDDGYPGVDYNAITAKIAHEHTKEERSPRLRLSQMGDRCPCALWHSIHSPSEAEPLPPYARFKYSYGHIIEAFAIQLAKASGHTVTGEQDEVVCDGIVGHRDCVIDGYVVDVKSTSSLGFKKFKEKTLAESDSFGYLAQLDAYILGSVDDPVVKHKDIGYIWAIDKTLGHHCLYEHRLRTNDIHRRIESAKAVVALQKPPGCTCGVMPDGKSGNLRLDIRASYNSFKHSCFPELRTFLYASGPVYLSKVVRKPDVVEIDKYGNYI